MAVEVAALHIGSFCSLFIKDFTAETIPKNSNQFKSWKFDFMTSYPRRSPTPSNKWEILQIPWPTQCLWNAGRLSILIRELSQMVWSPMFASEMAAASEKCNSSELNRTSQTKGLLILNNRVLKCEVIKMKFLKSWDLSRYSKRRMTKRPTYQKWAFRGKLSLRS